MPLFVVMTENKKGTLGGVIRKKYPEDHYVLAENKWFIEAEKTTQDLAEELGVRDGTYGKTLVFKIDAYSGFHNKDLWEWLQLR